MPQITDKVILSNEWREIYLCGKDGKLRESQRGQNKLCRGGFVFNFEKFASNRTLMDYYQGL